MFFLVIDEVFVAFLGMILALLLWSEHPKNIEQLLNPQDCRMVFFPPKRHVTGLLVTQKVISLANTTWEA